MTTRLLTTISLSAVFLFCTAAPCARALSEDDHTPNEHMRSVGAEAPRPERTPSDNPAQTVNDEPAPATKTLHPFRKATPKSEGRDAEQSAKAERSARPDVPNAASGGVAFQGNTSYQVANNTVTIKVERVINNGSGTTGSLRLTLWATESPYGGGSITGYTVGTYRFSSQLGPRQYFHDIVGQVPLTTPPSGNYYMTLTLDEYTGSGWVIRDYVSYSSIAHFGGGNGADGNGAPAIQGNTSWQIRDNLLTIKVDRVTNNGSGVTGSLRLQLWATRTPYGGGAITGYVLGIYQFTSQLGAGEYFYDIVQQLPFTMPSSGVYYTALTLEEYTKSGWVIRDHVAYNSTTSFGDGGSSTNPCGLRNTNTFGDPVSGVLTPDSCLNSGFRLDAYRFFAVAGNQVTITMQSAEFYTFLALFGPDGDLVSATREGWEDGWSQVTLTIPTTGEYHLLATSNNPENGGPGALGSYVLSLKLY